MFLARKELQKSSLNQIGINMVDLMMWLVIAVLLMAAAIQGIGFYQQTAYVYHAKSDLAGAYSWVSANKAFKDRLPTSDDMKDSLAKGELSLTSAAGKTNIGLIATSDNKFCLGIKSPNINDLTRNVFYSTSDDPANVIRGTAIPASCGTNITPFAPVGVDTSSAVPPAAAPVVNGVADSPTTAKFTWVAVPGASGYKVESMINGSTWDVAAPSQTELTIIFNGVGGDAISVRVTAINASGTSGTSNVAKVTLPNSSASDYAAWGANLTSQLNDGTVVNALTPVSLLRSGALAGRKIDYVKSGTGFSCALSQGKVFCWGRGDYGQIGNGAFINVVDPVEINMTAIGVRTITSLSVGDNHSCVLASGDVFCWGHNGFGKLGRGTASGVYNTPALATGALTGKTIDSVEAGINHTCAVSGGKAYCWGYNQYGEVKTGLGASVASPTAVDDSGVLSGVTVTAVSPAGYNTCLLGDGKVYCWGTVVGTGSMNYGPDPILFDPTGLLSGKSVTTLTSGASHTCALAEGKAYCWGQNLRNQIGNGGTYAGYYTAVLSDPYGIFIDREVTSLSAGGDHTCAVAGKRAFCWGYNASGELGDGTTTMRNVPMLVDSSGLLGGKTAVSVYAGLAGTFVGYNTTPVVEPGRPATSDPSFSVAAWGEDASGKLGDGTTNNALTPISVLNSGSLAGKKVTAVASGNSHSCAIADGEIHCWGDNTVGQLGNISTIASTAPVKVFSDGYLRNKIVTDLTMGSNYTCVIADGQAYCWGVNNFGQTGNDASGFYFKAPVPVGGPLSGKQVTKIDAGNAHTCAVSEGKAYCWGYNTEGELGNGDTTRTRTYFPVEASTSGVLGGKMVTEVSAGTWSTCVIADSKPYCWGSNQQKQLGATTASGSSDMPVAVNASGELSGKTVYSIGVGTYHACVLANAKVYCWGNNTSGELGTGATTMWSADPLATNPSGLLNGKTVLSMGVGENHSCAMTSEAKAYCWGFGNVGKLGNGGTANSNTPVLVDSTGVLAGTTPGKLWVGRTSAFIGY